MWLSSGQGTREGNYVYHLQTRCIKPSSSIQGAGFIPILWQNVKDRQAPGKRKGHTKEEAQAPVAELQQVRGHIKRNAYYVKSPRF